MLLFDPETLLTNSGDLKSWPRLSVGLLLASGIIDNLIVRQQLQIYQKIGAQGDVTESNK